MARLPIEPPARTARVVALYLTVEIALWMFVALASPFVPFNAHWIGADKYPFARSGSELERALSYYDGAYYLEIADKGYARVAELQGSIRPYAFFPLLPCLVRALRTLSGGHVPPFVLALGVNIMASLAAALLLHALYRRDHDEGVALRGVLFFLIFPAAPFYTALYAEPLFLALSLSSILLMRDRRFWAAGGAALLAALTRSQGVLLAVPLAIEWASVVRERARAGRRTEPRLLLAAGSIALAPAGLMVFALFCWSTTGRPWLFVEAQELWGRAVPGLAGLADVLLRQPWGFGSLPLHEFAASKLDLAFVLAFVALLPFIARHQRASYTAYAVTLLLLPLSTGRTTSMLRAMSLSFPHFLEMGILTRHRRAGAAIVVVLLLVPLVLVALRLVTWRWAG